MVGNVQIKKSHLLIIVKKNCSVEMKSAYNLFIIKILNENI